MSYFTNNGLLNLERNIHPENGILFLTYYIKLRFLNACIQYQDHCRIKLALESSLFIKNNKVWFQANPPQKGKHFSRDNMYGYYWLHAFKHKHCDGLPIFRWNDRTWIHPNGWMVFTLFKWSFLWALVIVPIMAMIYFSKAYRKYRWWRHKENHTSGALLWWLMFGTKDDNMLEDFTYYVTNRNTRKHNLDNPILVEARKLWQE